MHELFCIFFKLLMLRYLTYMKISQLIVMNIVAVANLSFIT